MLSQVNHTWNQILSYVHDKFCGVILEEFKVKLLQPKLKFGSIKPTQLTFKI